MKNTKEEMPNRNYIKGVRKERKIVNEARAKGLIAFRSAGSHSPIDCTIIDFNSGTIRFIQCKPDSMSQNKKNIILREMERLNNKFDVSFEVL